jgi:phenylpropionate dioxygenase-like ring-hydroxylating dioxygenase large terminal subunit
MAGGPDPEVFDWQEAWYPVHYLQDLDRSQPTPFTLLGQDLVIWWDPEAQCWRVFLDQCPHRLARLSEGRIREDGQLECPYHGWTFAGSGECTRIPQQPAGGKAEQSRRACVRSYPTAIRQGLLFVYAGEAERAAATPIPIIEALEEDPQSWVCLNTFRDLPYDALSLLENVLDSSHVPFTHHQSVGNRAYAGPVELEVTTSDRQGFSGLWEEGPRLGTLGRQTTRFVAPNFMWHDLTSKQFGRTLTVVYATPIRAGECRLFARFPFQFSNPIPKFFIQLSPRWYSHLGQNAVLEDDQIFLHWQERYFQTLGGSQEFSRAYYLPTKADRFVFELRQWVNQFQANPFADQALPPGLSTEALMDRYHSHTKHCSSCRQALNNVQRLRLGLAIGAVLLWSLSPAEFLLFDSSIRGITVGLTVALSLVLGSLWLGLGSLERSFISGRRQPPRNRS